jgi:hypothetical protein
MVTNTARALTSGHQGHPILEAGSRTRRRAMASKRTLMEVSTRATGSKIKNLARARPYGPVETLMKVTI